MSENNVESGNKQNSCLKCEVDEVYKEHNKKDD